VGLFEHLFEDGGVLLLSRWSGLAGGGKFSCNPPMGG